MANRLIRPAAGTHAAVEEIARPLRFVLIASLLCIAFTIALLLSFYIGDAGWPGWREFILSVLVGSGFYLPVAATVVVAAALVVSLRHLRRSLRHDLESLHPILRPRLRRRPAPTSG